MIGKVEEAFKKSVINPDAKTVVEIMNRTATRLYEWNPQFFASIGAHTDITNTTTKIKEIVDTIEVVQYTDGKEVSRNTSRSESEREEKSTQKKITPTCWQLWLGWHKAKTTFRCWLPPTS